MAVIRPTDTIALGVGDTEIVAQVAAGKNHRVRISIGNTHTAAVTFRLHKYDAGSAETALQTNAVNGWFDRSLAPNGDETLTYQTLLTPGFKLSGQASVADKVVVDVQSDIQE